MDIGERNTIALNRRTSGRGDLLMFAGEAAENVLLERLVEPDGQAAVSRRHFSPRRQAGACIW
jgi:hypothetical protein